jgi:hypothetical protein
VSTEHTAPEAQAEAPRTPRFPGENPEGSWRCEVVTGDDKTWAANGLRFDDHDSALSYGTDLFSRWMVRAPRWRAVDTSVPERQPYEPGSEEKSWS